MQTASDGRIGSYVHLIRHLNDDLQGAKDGGYDLYPRSGGSDADDPFGYYTAGALWEEWSELASAAGIERPR
jgi:hypothetical protein